VLFAVLLASLTAALIGTLSYTRSRRALEAEARTRLALMARDVAEHLHGELEERVADITNWAHLEVMRALLYRDVDKELAQFLDQMVRGREVYRAIVSADASGAEVARAGEPSLLAPHAPPTRTRLTVVASAPPSLQLETAVSNPDEPGAPIGTLVVLLDSRRLLDSIAPAVAPDGARPLLLVTGHGGDAVLASDEATEAAPLLRGSAPMAALRGADGPDLKVVVGEPRSSALAAVAELRATLFRIGALALLVSSALGALVAWWISLPIRRLTATVRGIGARGRLEEPVELPRAGGEVGVLAGAFQAMMDGLRAAQAEALAQSRRAFLGEIAANIAHEVRTPLSVLKTSAQLLARQELTPTEQRLLATNVAAEVDRLNGVVTNLVDLARPKPVLYRTESLGDILERTVTFFGPQAGRLGVTISRTTADPPPRIHGSADQLHQVFLNVIHNAFQAMGGPGRLCIDCFRADGWAVVEVSDTGPGFSPEALAEAFAPFRSTKADGAGLGLAISKRIVEEHGGTIGVESAPGAGACLRIRLPIRPEAA
jgi:two-component system, NtrC family, sensor histidine kinase HydH